MTCSSNAGANRQGKGSSQIDSIKLVLDFPNGTNKRSLIGLASTSPLAFEFWSLKLVGQNGMC